MEEGETVPILSRKELRKQKLMEYLAAKGKLKQPNPRPYLRDDHQLKKPITAASEMALGKENTAPAGKVINEGKRVSAPTAQTTKNPARRTFGVANKVDEKGSTGTGRQKIHHLSAASYPAQPKVNQYPVFSKTYTVFSSKSKPSSTSHSRKQPTTGIKTSDKTSLSVVRAVVTKPNNRVSSSALLPTKTLSARMSLGPVVQTKTGLIPAVTQPRQNPIKSQTHIPLCTTTNTTSAPKNVRPSTSATGSVSQRKTLTVTTTKKPLNERGGLSSTARAQIGVQNQNRANSKTLIGQSSGLKTASHSSKSTTAPNKPDGRFGGLKPAQSTRQPIGASLKQRSETEGKKNSQPFKVISRASSSRCSSRLPSWVSQNAGAEHGKKNETHGGTDGKKGNSTAFAFQTHTGIKKTHAPLISQTAPQPGRTISVTGQARKMQKVTGRVIPQTEGKKLTAVQEERMKKLQEWREARGISYKRPPMPVKPQVRRTVAVPQPFWASMAEEDEARSLISAVDSSLADCIKLLSEGCPTDQVKGILSRLPSVSHKFAKYWICQARLMEQEGNLDVLPMFEEAVGVVLEPVDELRTVVFEILKKKDEIQASEEEEEEKGDQITSDINTPESANDPMMTPKPVRALIYGEKGGSSVVKYKITATPGGPASQQKEPARVNGQEVRFFTPVRRSVRIERASLRYPVSLQEHDLCVTSYNDLISEEESGRSDEQKDGEISPSTDNTPMYVYRENEALKEKVFVQLVCDESI